MCNVHHSNRILLTVFVSQGALQSPYSLYGLHFVGWSLNRRAVSLMVLKEKMLIAPSPVNSRVGVEFLYTWYENTLILST